MVMVGHRRSVLVDQQRKCLFRGQESTIEICEALFFMISGFSPGISPLNFALYSGGI